MLTGEKSYNEGECLSECEGGQCKSSTFKIILFLFRIS